MKPLSISLIISTLFIGIAIVISANVALKRFLIDIERKQAQFSIRESTLNDLMIRSGNDVQKMLSILKKQIGVKTIIVPEYTIADYESRSKLTILAGSDIINRLRVGQLYRTVVSRLSRRAPISTNSTYIVVDEVRVYKRLINYLKLSFPVESIIEHTGRIVEVKADESTVRSIPLGFDKKILNHYISYDFNIIPEFRPMRTLSPSAIELKFNELQSIETINSILFSERFVFGNSKFLELIIKKIKKQNYFLIYPEFNSKADYRFLAMQIPNNVVRTHLLENDHNHLSFSDAYSRYWRALQERSIHLIELTLINDPNNYYDKNIVFMKRVIDSYSRSGGRVIDYFLTQKTIKVSFYELVSIGLGIFSSLFLILVRVHRLNLERLRLVLAVGLFVAFVIVMVTPYTVSALGILAAISGPIFGFVYFYPSVANNSYSFLKKVIKNAIALICIIFACLVSALFCIALYSSPVFLQAILPFYGVKLSLLLPVILISILYFCGPKHVNSVYYVFRRLFNRQFTVRSFFIILAILFIGGAYLIRSGNYIDVLSLEKSIRMFLENQLIFRPRFKEILIGYPALLFGLWAVNDQKNSHKLWIFNGLGCIALTSFINSFCHFHTPLIVSIYRGALGLVIGFFASILLGYVINISKTLFKSLSVISK